VAVLKGNRAEVAEVDWVELLRLLRKPGKTPIPYEGASCSFTPADVGVGARTYRFTALISG